MGVRLKPRKRYRTKYIGIRCTDIEYHEIKLKAGLYTEGNISEYILYAVLKFKPSKQDLIEEAPANREPLI